MMTLVAVTLDIKRLYISYSKKLIGCTCLVTWNNTVKSHKCNASKQSAPVRAPMTSTPIGKPWQIVVVDILEVPVSSKNNRYLLAVQNYFIKWVEVVPMPDQTTTRIVEAITNIFCCLRILEVLHSDQGHNFEFVTERNTKGLWDKQVAHNCIPTMVLWNIYRSLLEMSHSYVEAKQEWEKYLPLM